MEHTSDFNEFRLASITCARIANETASSAPHLRRVVLLCTTLDSFHYRTQQADLDSLEENPKDDASAQPGDYDTSTRPALSRPLVVVSITELDPGSDSASDSDPDPLWGCDGDSDDDTSISSSSSGNNGHGDAEDEFGQEGGTDCDFDPRLAVSFDYDTDSRDKCRQWPGYLAAECPRLSQKSQRDTHYNGILTSREKVISRTAINVPQGEAQILPYVSPAQAEFSVLKPPGLRAASVYNRS